MLIKRAFQISVLAITFAVTAAVSATVQSYPTRPITIIVPFPPGGNSDLVIRYLADRLSVSLNQPVIVENRAGGRRNGRYEGVRERKSGWLHAPVLSTSGAAGYRTVDL